MPDIDQHTTDILGMESGEALQVDRDIAAVRDGRAPAPEERRPRTGRDAAIEHGMGLSEEMFREDQGTRDVEPREPRYEEVQEPRDQQMVPARVIQEERERRRVAEQAAQDARDAARRAEERFQLMQETIRSEQQARLAPKPEPLPNPEEDIVGYVRAIEKRYGEELDAVRRENEQLRTSQTETAAQTRQREEMESAVRYVKTTTAAGADQIRSTVPDVNDAYHWQRSQRIAELMVHGMDQARATEYADNEEVQIAASHIRAGRNPAEQFYKAAQARGWNGSQRQQQRRAPMQPSMTEPPAPRHQQTLDNVRAGMMESATIAHAAGGGSASPLSLAAYAEMDDATFARHYGGGKGNNKIDAILKRETGGRRR